MDLIFKTEKDTKVKKIWSKFLLVWKSWKKQSGIKFLNLLYINVNQVYYPIIVCYKKIFLYYNWNCSQFEQKQNFIFLLFCWIHIGDILNFKSARLKVNSLPFYKNAFYIEIASKRLFQWMGVRAL